MATLLVTIPDFTSHVLPILPIAQALADRGHRVLVHTRPEHHEKVQAAGAELVPMSDACEIKFQVDHSSLPIPWWLPPFAHGLWRFRNGVLSMIPAMVNELEAVIQREQVDCLIGDYIGYGASYTAERMGIPYVTVSVSWTVTPDENSIPSFLTSLPLPPRIVHTLIDAFFPLRRVRRQLGLPPRPHNTPAEFLSIIVSKLLNLVTIHREFIRVDRLQENQVFIGPTAFQMPRTSEGEPYGASLQPGTVLVSTTTSATSDDGLFMQVLKPIAQMGMPVLATSGATTDIPTDLGENVRLEKFVPFDEVLPYISALVTHGGFGTVGRAFRLGVPMLIIPAVGDSEATAVRAAELGLAYYLPKKKATPELIQAKLKALLEDTALHDRVKALAEQLSVMDSPELGANAIESVLQPSQIKPSAQTAEPAAAGASV
jgi:MGT family glycosyltransferase